MAYLLLLTLLNRNRSIGGERADLTNDALEKMRPRYDLLPFILHDASRATKDEQHLLSKRFDIATSSVSSIDRIDKKVKLDYSSLSHSWTLKHRI